VARTGEVFDLHKTERTARALRFWYGCDARALTHERCCTAIGICDYRQALSSVARAFLETEDLPTELRPAIVEHMMLVHQSVRQFSARFAEELRRHNYVTVRLAQTVHKPMADNVAVWEIA